MHQDEGRVGTTAEKGVHNIVLPTKSQFIRILSVPAQVEPDVHSTLSLYLWCVCVCVCVCVWQVNSLQEEIRQLKERNQQLGLEVKKRDNAIASLKTDIEGLRREIQERDDTIQDKV